jgi:hypothetical protein
MSSYKKYKNSRFLTQADVENEPVVTYVETSDLDLAMPGEKRKERPCTKFKELDKRLVTNVTNFEAIAGIAGTDEMDQWPGVQVQLYWDPDVAFRGKVTGGIRIRAPRAKPAQEKPVLMPTTVPDEIAC